MPPFKIVHRAAGCLFSLVLLPGISVADGLTLDDIARTKSVTSVHISPDGESVAYLVRDPLNPFTDENGEARTELMIVRDGEDARRYMGGKHKVSAVQWSSDSNAIYFLAKHKDAEHNQLQVMQTDGGAARVVCDLKDRSISAYSVAPDNSQVAFISSPAKSAEEKAAEEAGFDASVYEESRRRSELSLSSMANGPDCEVEALDLEGHVAEAQYSPDGNRLLLKVAPSPHVDDGYMQTRMRVIDLEGSVRSRIENLGKLGDAHWSPDGKQIAYIGVSDFNDPSTGRLKLADVASGDVRTLLFGLEGHVQKVAWADKRTLIATVHLGVESELWRVDLNSGNHTSLIPQGELVLRDMSLSADGKTVALIADSPAFPKELFVWRNDELKRRTVSNAWLQGKTLGKQVALEYQATDGLSLQGLVVYPTDYRKGERYPLLVFVHGGPESHRSNGWLTTYGAPIQHAAANGYVSFIPNYRGSTGRGVAFSKLDQHAYATPEFDDIVDGKNELVDMGAVDADKVGITGGSYGGYATAWSATALTEHYAAGVMFVGISNQISKFGTSDIPQEMHAVHSRAWPWDDWQFMLERSPIYHATKSRTPLLIMHGDADPRVHPSESLQMYRYLKLAGQAPVRLIWYPGEKHGNQKAAAQYDYSVRLMRWMDHYLKGPGGEPPPYPVDYSEKLNGGSR